MKDKLLIKKFFFLILVRMEHATIQIIPSWADFNLILRYKLSTLQEGIGYFPSINALAILMATIHEILRKVMQIKHKTGTKSVMVKYRQFIKRLWKIRRNNKRSLSL